MAQLRVQSLEDQTHAAKAGEPVDAEATDAQGLLPADGLRHDFRQADASRRSRRR